MIAILRSLLFMPVFYLGSIPFVIGAFLGSFIAQPMLYFFVRSWSQFHAICAKWILGITIRVEGTLSKKPVLYAVKHEAMFETIDMPRMFHLPAVVAKQELFKIPLWGHAAKNYGVISVDRDAGAGALRRMIGWGKEMQASERPIVIFPEGTRVAHGTQPALQSGFAGLYKLLGLPVVPIAVDSGKLCPRDGLIRYSGTITYKIGEEIPPGLSREDIESRVHKAINALNS
jgi:1-acyl-sn-glycerol-3-phosphate acyltransferase